MIYRRAIFSSLKHSQSPKSLNREPFSRISTSFSLSTNPIPSSPFSSSSSSYSSISNQKRFDFRCFSPFYGNRNMSTRRINDSGSNNNMPPKETILLDGCDFEHWLVVLEAPDPNLTRDEIIDSYVKTLAQCVGSEEEARKSIYSVSTKHYFAFSCIVSEELSYKIKELPKVRWVLPDSYLDVPNKKYGGEPFINGEAVPYDPKYHELWVRNYTNSKNNNNKNRDRKRNDRDAFSGRRRDNMINNQIVPSSSPSPNLSSTTPAQNFTPASPGRSSLVQNSDFQRSNMPPPQVQNGYFQNRDTHMQNQSQYASSPPAQNREFQSGNDPSMSNGFQPSLQNQNLRSNNFGSFQNNFGSFQNKHLDNRDMPPVQNVRSSDGSNLPPVQNPGFQNENNVPPVQNPIFHNGNNIPHVQNPRFHNGNNMPPVQNPGFQNGNNMPPIQNPGFHNGNNVTNVQNPGFQNGNNMPPVQNPGFQNGNNMLPVQNPGFQNGNNVPSPGFQNALPNFNVPNSAPNHGIRGNVLPSRVDENFQPGYQQNHNANIGILPNDQNREAPGFANPVNMQYRVSHRHDMPGYANSFNTQNRGYQGQNKQIDTNIPSQNAQNSAGDYEAMASRKF